MATFKIVFKDGRATLKNQTLDEILAFKIANLSDTSFTIEEMGESMPKPKKEKELDLEELRNKFVASLLPAQYNDVSLGNKEIRYSAKIGYYLKVVKTPSGEIHHSHELIKEQRTVKAKQLLKDFLLVEVRKSGGIGDFTPEELAEIVSKWKL